MRIRIIVVLFLVSAFPLRAQQDALEEAFETFATSRFWQHEEIAVTWNMKGTMQANFNEGLNNLIEGNPEMAESNFTDVLKEDFNSWQAYYYRAATRKVLKKLKDAQYDLLRVIKLNPDCYEAHVELAKVYHLRHDIDESESSLKHAISLNKSKPAAYYLKGDLDLQQNQTRSAVNNYEQCLAADSMFHDARIKLALVELSIKKNKSEAIRRLDKVLKYDSLQKTALLFRSILNMADNKKQSIADLTNLIRVSPNNMMAYYYRGIISAELFDYERAFADFRKVIKANETSDNNFAGQQTWLDKKIDMQNAGHYTVSRIYGLSDQDAARLREAYCHILTGRYNESITAITRTANPKKEPLCIYLLAVSYEHKGEHDKAYQFYNLALQLDNDIADAHKKRAIYEQELKQWDRSIQDLNEVLRLTPDAFVIYKIRGTSYFYLDRYSNAISDYSKYLENDSTNKEILSFRGMAYKKNEEYLKSYADFAQSDTRQMLDFKHMSHLVDSALSKGDTLQTMDALDKITYSCPYFTEGFVVKMKIHVKRGEWDTVEKEIARALRNSRADAPKSHHAYLLTVQAMSFVRQNHHDDAMKAFDDAIRANRTNDLAYFERGKLWINMGKKSKAESDLKQASSLGNKQAEQLLASVNK